jgi:hypothetical protein
VNINGCGTPGNSVKESARTEELVSLFFSRPTSDRDVSKDEKCAVTDSRVQTQGFHETSHNSIEEKNKSEGKTSSGITT